MHFSRECGFYWWTGWLAWVLAIWAFLFGEYAWRVPDPPAGYFFEAGAAMLGWLVALALADHFVVAVYRRAWQLLKQQSWAPVMLDSGNVDLIRSELRANPLIRWLRPPRSEDIRAQLLTASLWWPAFTAPEGATHWRRYGEWIIDALLGYMPLLAAVVIVALALAGAWPTWRGMGTAALLGSLGMAVLGYSLLRLSARRQAILDYFNAWREERSGDL
jgi:hypothetical protein